MQAFFRSVFFIPTACSYVVASLIWKLSIFNGVNFGLANTVLGQFGHSPIAWLTLEHPPWYWIPLVTLRLWLQVGFYMILFLAGLQRIPRRVVRKRRRWTAQNPAGRHSGTSRCRSCGRRRRGAYPAAHRRLSGVRRVLQPPRNVNYARPPLEYLYYISLARHRIMGTVAPAH